MKVTEVRLTLAAYIYSIEDDLRDIIRNYIVPYSEGNSFLGNEQIVQKVEARYKKDNPYLIPSENLYDLVDYIDFQDSYEIILKNQELISENILNEIKNNFDKLQSISAIRNRVMHTRPLESGDFILVYTFAQDINSGSLVWRNLNETKLKLEQDPSFVLSITLPQLEEDSCHVMHNLPNPDFDETGFIGRKEDVFNIKKLLLSGQKVISIIGDGGVGKSALALKVVYDILDMKEKCPYEMILWVSAKSTVLTPKGIEEIKEAITSSTDIIKNIGDKVSNTTDSLQDNINIILDFLKELKILLIIDNLETVIDNKILEFIREAQLYSQIIITSRIGLGELEYKCILHGLQPKEASHMIKEMARIRNNLVLKSINNELMLDIVKKLYCNPLSLKWFVNSIEIGKPLEEVLQNKKDLLSYCLSNVYNNLSENARLIIAVLLAKRKSKVNLPELSYLTDLEPLTLRQSINELSKTTILIQEYSTNTGNQETLYSLSTFAQDYLLKYHTPNRQFIKKIDKKSHNLMSNESEIARIKDYNKYRIEAIEISNQTEKVVAKVLYEAIVCSRKKNFEEANKKIEFAKNTAAYFPEVYIISASINISKGDILNAEYDYDTALEIAPNNCRLLFFYANFLLIQKNDSKTAYEYIEKLYHLDNSIEPQILHIRCQGYNGSYEKAINNLYNILNDSGKDLNNKNIAILMQTILTFSMRLAADKHNIEKDSLEASKIIFKALECFGNHIESTNYDKKLINEFAKLMSFSLNNLSKHVSDNINLLTFLINKYKNLLLQSKLCKSIINQIKKQTNINVDFYTNIFSDDKEDQYFGRIYNFDKEKGYGFISSPMINNGRLFFHKSYVLNLYSIDELRTNRFLSFELGQGKNGECAINVILLPDEST